MSTEQSPKELAEALGGKVGREAGERILDLARTHLLSSASKPGNKTSEYRLCAGALICALALIGGGIYTGDPQMRDQGVELVKWAVGSYAATRGLAKFGAGLGANKENPSGTTPPTSTPSQL